VAPIEYADDSPTGRHTHPPPNPIEEATDRCPLCGQPVTKAQYSRIQKQIEAQVRARLEEAEKTLRESFAQQVKAEVEKGRREAAKAAQQQVKAAMANQEKVINQRLQLQRASLEKAKSAAVNAEREKHFREQLKLEERLAELQKRLQQQTANELGDKAELDLLSELKREFPKDQIDRITKGKAGGDIIHRVTHNNQICGTILFESKNTSRFMNNYISKLRNDVAREQADHGVLVSVALPAAAAGRQLHPSDGVLIVTPRLVIPVVHLLRQQILQAHALRLGKEGRREQRDALYEFVVSNATAELWSEFAKLTEAMSGLDKAEMENHRRVWAKRGDLVASLIGLHDRLSDTVNKIIEMPDAEASP
jgi:hypothetical protein